MKYSLFVCLLVLVFSGDGFAQMGSGIMKAGQKGEPQKTFKAPPGAGLYWTHCALCHPNGENVIEPELPIKDSAKIAQFKTFLDFIRHPKMPDGSEGEMPVFPQTKISDQQARKLFNYISYAVRAAMTGGYAQGPGYGGGPGMMGMGMEPGFYGYSPECQKFYEETHNLRKELVDKRFDYFEVLRNPKSTGETAAKFEKELTELQDKIYAQAPLGCAW